MDLKLTINSITWQNTAFVLSGTHQYKLISALELERDPMADNMKAVTVTISSKKDKLEARCGDSCL